MKLGALVTVHYGDTDEQIRSSPPSWFAAAAETRKPMIFLGWLEDSKPFTYVHEEGWAKLLHPDGTIKVIHCDYFSGILR